MRLLAAVFTVVLTWPLVLPRLIASSATAADTGTFRSVAERLLAGDALYSGVWDNKDPLFFYSIALALEVHPIASVMLDVLWLATACLSVAWLLRSMGASSSRAVLVGWALTSLVVLGSTYVAGMTHLPGTAVSLLCLALLFQRRYLLSGLALGMVLFLKVTTAPVVGVMALAVVLLLPDRRAALMRGIIGLVTFSVAMAAVLGMRGELRPYLGMLRLNIGYSDALTSGGGWESLSGHWLRVYGASGASAGGIMTIVGIGVVLLCTIPASTQLRTPRGQLFCAAVAGLAGSAVIISATGQWNHHAQVFYLPASAALIILATVRGIRGVRGASLLALAAYALGGCLHPSIVIDAWPEAQTRATTWIGPSDDARALTQLVPDGGSYMRLGNADRHASARGLRQWNLTCARLAQYNFDPVASRQVILRCLDRTDAVVIGSPSIMDKPEGVVPGWDQFLVDVQAKLDSDYTCTPVGSPNVNAICLRDE